jgi:hypothetical protein
MKRLAPWLAPIMIALLWFQDFARPGRLHAIVLLIVMGSVWFACVHLLRGNRRAQAIFTAVYVFAEFVCFGLLGPHARVNGNPEPVDYFAIAMLQALFIVWMYQKASRGAGSQKQGAAAMVAVGEQR